MSSAKRPPFPVDFNKAPFIVIWEATRACDLVCRHCRAQAQPRPDPQQLSTAEGKALLDHIRDEFGPVLMVITGGDPLKRSDLDELIAHGHGRGLRMTIAPSATPLLTPERIAQLKAVGIQRMALSLDGADAATHDGFRRVDGTYERTMTAFACAHEMGLETQMNTTLGRHNLDQLEAVAEIGRWHGISLWSVFQLVATGRASADMMLSPVEQEKIFRRLAEIAESESWPFDVKTTAGQPFYRVRAQRLIKQQGAAGRDWKTQGLRSPRSVNDGKGICFISHTGEVQPSGFLQIPLGNIRERSLASIYRDDPVFRRLRDPDSFSGKCGECEYNDLCGGSRSRAWSLNDDAFSSDPTCLYQPKGRAVV
ncbi:MAG: TIGR04053 family radical SAM/SPASM domain-containing protein [Planctomycetota bacterium]|nr:TIGR04053 family radical SAM/SPASM domain-containing protein [Planctomycetota bacterium]